MRRFRRCRRSISPASASQRRTDEGSGQVTMKHFASLFLSLALTSSAFAATITIINNDAQGQGFNDPAPATPVGGNNGTTLGEQRLNVFKWAADFWGRTLNSAV